SREHERPERPPSGRSRSRLASLYPFSAGFGRSRSLFLPRSRSPPQPTASVTSASTISHRLARVIGPPSARHAGNENSRPCPRTTGFGVTTSTLLGIWRLSRSRRGRLGRRRRAAATAPDDEAQEQAAERERNDLFHDGSPFG